SWIIAAERYLPVKGGWVIQKTCGTEAPSVTIPDGTSQSLPLGSLYPNGSSSFTLRPSGRKLTTTLPLNSPKACCALADWEPTNTARSSQLQHRAAIRMLSSLIYV